MYKYGPWVKLFFLRFCYRTARKRELRCAFLSTRSISIGRPPGKPGRPFAAKVEGTSVSLRWTAPVDNGGHAAICYLVKYGLVSSSSDHYATERVDQAATTSHVFKGKLEPNASYRFAVAAVNRVGEGDWSELSEPIHTKTGSLHVSVNQFIRQQRAKGHLLVAKCNIQ